MTIKASRGEDQQPYCIYITFQAHKINIYWVHFPNIINKFPRRIRYKVFCFEKLYFLLKDLYNERNYSNRLPRNHKKLRTSFISGIHNSLISSADYFSLLFSIYDNNYGYTFLLLSYICSLVKNIRKKSIISILLFFL